jgi:2-keto-3-deoxy-L-rhamnonate aldolase RhmA
MAMSGGPAETAGRRLLERLMAGETCLALGLRNARSSDIVRLAAGLGYDLAWIDMEHAAIGIETAVALASVAGDLGLCGWVRIPEGQEGLAGPLLDGGAGGIIFPHIETVEQAAAAVAACRFPPAGDRSQNALLPQLAYRSLPAAERMGRADRAAIVQLVIETPAAIAGIEAIAAVPGVDMIAVGLNDLAAAMGLGGETGHPDLIAACRTVAAACRAHGVVPVAGGAGRPSLFRTLVAAGMAPLAFAAMDLEALADILAQRRDRWRPDPIQ